jgi:hypothetical protein
VNRQVKVALTASRAPLLFRPAEGAGFFAPFGWRLAESRSFVAEAVAMKRLPPLLRLAVSLLAIAPKARRDEVRKPALVIRLTRADDAS